MNLNNPHSNIEKQGSRRSEKRIEIENQIKRMNDYVKSIQQNLKTLQAISSEFEENHSIEKQEHGGNVQHLCESRTPQNTSKNTSKQNHVENVNIEVLD